MISKKKSLTDLFLQNATYVMFGAVVLYFGVQQTSFLMPDSMANVVKQASFIGIAAIGMTFVLLTAGIDLSVGSVMYVAPLIAGLLMQALDLPPSIGLFIAIVVGGVLGALNAFFIVVLRIVPFIATLSSLFLFRGFGTWLTSSKQFDFADEFRAFGLSSLFHIPLPIWVFALVLIFAHYMLSHTGFGRQVYALGNSQEGARKAGLKTASIQARCYMMCSACAALSGYMLISQIGRLDAGFGEGSEFDVIAAAVLGGVSLFGGVGSVFNAAVGAILIQTVKLGLVFTGVNLYAQPIMQGFIIFLAVLVDGIRDKRTTALLKRTIRPIQ